MKKNDSLVEVHAIKFLKGEKISSEVIDDFLFDGEFDECLKPIDIIDDEFEDVQKENSNIISLNSTDEKCKDEDNEFDEELEIDLEFTKDMIGFRFAVIGEGSCLQFSSGIEFECSEEGFDGTFISYIKDFEKIANKLFISKENERQENLSTVIENVLVDQLKSVRFIVLFDYEATFVEEEYKSEFSLKGIFDLKTLTLESIENFLSK